MSNDEEDAIFQLACALGEDELEDLFVTTCGDNAELRARLEKRLAEDRAQEDPGEEDTLAADPQAADEVAFAGETVGTHIGPYTLVKKLGEGGMGTVWEAAQEKPVKRTVALKIIKAGMDSAEVIARFQAERQALAMMDHPNIAHVHDAGATARGRPFFVMEMVNGPPITRYCDEHRLSPEDRLKLFIEVCHGLQHAHQKGVIHRDIKPSNILVTEHDGKPVPKLIDFGIAKATGEDLTEMTLHTMAGQMMGTPVYMSPEQASGRLQDIDTRTDVYALGVLLYELLTGTTPIDAKALRAAGYVEMQRMVAETEPPRPSLRVTTLGGSLGKVMEGRAVSSSAKLRRVIEGDLDWIVMRALEKEPERRYVTVRGFAVDIERYLKSEPVEACPPSALYRLKKFARRNQGILKAAAVVAVVVLAAVAVNVFDRRSLREDQAAASFGQLLGSPANLLEPAVKEVRDSRRYLREEAKTTTGAKETARKGLAFIDQDPERIDEILNWLLDSPTGELAEPEELGAFLRVLGEDAAKLQDVAREVLNNEGEDSGRGLRAAAICAAVDPGEAELGKRKEEIAGWLVDRDVVDAARWLPLLKPIDHLLIDSLEVVFDSDPDHAIGESAALALAEFQSSNLRALIALARRAGGQQLSYIAGVLARNPAWARDGLEGEIATGLGKVSRQDDELAKLAIVLLKMNQPAEVWPLLDHAPDPGLRTSLLHSIAEYNVSRNLLVDRLRTPTGTDGGILSAILLALGDFKLAQLPLKEREDLRTGLLEDLYATHADSGVRSAARWLISQWLSQEPDSHWNSEDRKDDPLAERLKKHFALLDQENRTGAPIGSRKWFVTNKGDFTMALVRDDGRKSDAAIEERPEHRFAIATTEVTRELFEEFLSQNPEVQAHMTPEQIADLSIKRDENGDGPKAAVTFVSLREASLFCFWFSKREEIDEDELCYDYDPVTGVIGTRDGWLQREGYRLPTEAEWEVACRAGTLTDRFFGSGAEWLAEYAWFASGPELRRASRIPGLLRPNPLGLFDILGNGSELCQEFYSPAYASYARGEAFEIPEQHDPREIAFRGGSSWHIPSSSRSGYRGSSNWPRYQHYSFRLVATVNGD